MTEALENQVKSKVTVKVLHALKKAVIFRAISSVIACLVALLLFAICSCEVISGSEFMTFLEHDKYGYFSRQSIPARGINSKVQRTSVNCK
jgi:hypothetical protein